MSTSNIKILDNRKERIQQKKKRIKQDAKIKSNYNERVLKQLNIYKTNLQDKSDKNEYIIEEVDRLNENYLENEDDIELQIQIKALGQLIDQQLYELNELIPDIADEVISSKNVFNFYPDLADKDFNKTIYHKKEFHDYRILSNKDKSLEEISNDECRISDTKDEMDLELSNVQHFVKNYLSPNTPYNSVLLFHGVGVGKTCSSISIAEQFRLIGKYTNIFVLLSPSIEENFKKELFDVNKFYRQKGYLGCTGDKFLNEIENANYYIKDAKNKGHKAKSIEKLQKKMNKVKKRNYTFMGYDKFASYVLKLEREFTRGVKKDERQQRVKEIISDIFSNSVMIIDEAHHLRETSAKFKYAPPIIERVLEHSKNMKLILLTATPMYDNPRELISLINLMLVNDEKPKISVSDIFDVNNNFTDDGEQILSRKIRGYISYVRGENPVAFPLRLDADINKTPIGIIKGDEYPNLDLNGKSISSKDKIDPKKIKIIGCKMSKEHYDIYKKIVGKYTTPKSQSISLDTGDTEAKSGTLITDTAATSDTASTSDIAATGDTAAISGTATSDTLIADTGDTAAISGTATSDTAKDDTAVTSDIAKDDKLIEDTGSSASMESLTDMAIPEETEILVDESEDFLSSFNITIGLQVSNIFYNDDISNAYGKSGLNSVVTKTGLNTYTYNDIEIFSPENIGTYSCKIKKILDNIKDSKGIIFIYSQFIDSGVIPLALALEHHGYKRYGNNQLLNSSNKVKSTIPMGNYIMITSDRSRGGLSYNLRKHMDVLNASDNKTGNKIKIILGSPAASEGLSFLRVREIHILDPWHNFNRLEQAIGRGIRRCSHKDLPLKERNVTIYYYASIIDKDTSDDDIETVDLKTYRIAVNKVFKIAKVERIIKKNAIDCNLMKENNLIKKYDRFTNKTITTSKNKDVDNQDLFDEEDSRNCNYMECDYECNPPEDELDDSNINKDTYNIIYARTDINKTKKIIKKMYNDRFIYTMNDIIKIVKNKVPNIDDIFIYEAVKDLIDGNDKDALIDKYNRKGHIIHRGEYYIFQPFILDDNTLPLYYRRTPLTIKKNSFSINTLAKDTKQPSPDIDDIQIEDIKELILAQKGVLRNMVFERLLFKKKKKLYDDLVLKYDENNDFHKFLIANYSLNLIRNYHIGILGKSKDNIIGYRLGDENKKIVSYCRKDDNVEVCGHFQKGKLDTSIKKLDENSANMIAFMDRTETKKDFKQTAFVRDKKRHKGIEKNKDEEFEDATLEQLKKQKTMFLMKFSDEIGTLGYFCLHSAGRTSKDELVSYLIKLGNNTRTNKDNRLPICHSLEVQLRNNDKNEKDGKRWFYTFEEAISLGYFSKKKK